MTVYQGVPFTRNGITTWHQWHTPMHIVEKIVAAGRARAKANRPPPVPDGYKQCGGECEQILPATTEHFNKNYQTRSRLSYRCKVCKSKRDRQIRLEKRKKPQ